MHDTSRIAITIYKSFFGSLKPRCARHLSHRILTAALACSLVRAQFFGSTSVRIFFRCATKALSLDMLNTSRLIRANARPISMTHDELKARFPNGSADFFRDNLSAPPHCETPAPLLERDPRSRPLAARKAQGPAPTRFLVRVTSFRRRLLDEDNLCAKFMVDCARYAGILQGDDPAQAKISVGQIKVARKEDERTEIEISLANGAD